VACGLHTIQSGVSSIAIPICVGISVPGSAAIEARVLGIHPAITVIVGPVADLKSVWVYGRVRVVTVRVVRRVARGLLTRTHGLKRGRSIPISIAVGVPAGCIHSGFVDHVVAVIVPAVADLHGPGVVSRLRVVAITACSDVAGVAIATLSHGIRVPVSVPIDIRIPGVAYGVVDSAVAVIVDVITCFQGTGVNLRVFVVAIGVDCIAVFIQVIVEGGLIAVIVHSVIGHFLGIRVHTRVVIITVIGGLPAICVGVRIQVTKLETGVLGTTTREQQNRNNEQAHGNLFYETGGFQSWRLPYCTLGIALASSSILRDWHTSASIHVRLNSS